MAEVFTIEKAIIAAQHDTFHSEVITGKAGGSASGAEIDTATNTVTGQVQTTLPKVLRDVGFKPASFNFVTGGTLGVADADKFIYNPAPAGDNNWYSWGGVLPHTVAPGADPKAVGSGYVPRTDVVLRSELAGNGGAGLVGGLIKPVTWSGFAGGADPTGIASSKAAFQSADASVYAWIYVPEGSYNIEDYVPTKPYFGPGKLLINGGSIRSLDSIPNVPNYNAPNTVVGASASYLGAFNTIYGYNTGYNFGPTAKRNTLVGHNLGSGDTIYPEENQPFIGSDNNGFGYHALKKLQSGSSNNAHGGDALNELTTGSHNNAYGQAAAQQIKTQSDGCYFGGVAGGRADSGNGRASYFGRDSGRENRDTSNNTLSGWGCGRGVTPAPSTYTGDGVTVAFNVPGFVFTGTKQVRVDVGGVNILPTNYSVSGTDGVVTMNFAPAVGESVVLTPTIGSSSWSEVSSYGARSLYKLRAGSRLTVSGFSACENLDSGNNSVVIGDEAAYSAVTMANSIIIGSLAYRAVTDIQNKFIVANSASTPFLDGALLGAANSGNYLRIDGALSPASANTRLCGTSARPWAGGATQTAFDITSDETMKEFIAQIPDAVLDAWGLVNFYQYKLKSQVALKGDEARLHLGVLAQEIVRVFDEAGLNACDYGIVCLSEWEAELDVLDEDGAVLHSGIEAGARWSVRYEECLVLECAYQRRRCDLIEARLSAAGL